MFKYFNRKFVYTQRTCNNNVRGSLFSDQPEDKRVDAVVQDGHAFGRRAF